MLGNATKAGVAPRQRDEVVGSLPEGKRLEAIRRYLLLKLQDPLTTPSRVGEIKKANKQREDVELGGQFVRGGGAREQERRER